MDGHTAISGCPSKDGFGNRVGLGEGDGLVVGDILEEGYGFGDRVGLVREMGQGLRQDGVWRWVLGRSGV